MQNKLSVVNHLSVVGGWIWYIGNIDLCRQVRLGKSLSEELESILSCVQVRMTGLGTVSG